MGRDGMVAEREGAFLSNLCPSLTISPFDTANTPKDTCRFGWRANIHIRLPFDFLDSQLTPGRLSLPQYKGSSYILHFVEGWLIMAEMGNLRVHEPPSLSSGDTKREGRLALVHTRKGTGAVGGDESCLFRYT